MLYNLKMAVLCLNNDRQIRTCNKGVYKKLMHAERCMYIVDFVYVVYAQYISKNVDLKNHIKTHSQMACLERQLSLTIISIYGYIG